MSPQSTHYFHSVLAPANVLGASPVHRRIGLEMCSATPPDNCKLSHTPRKLPRAGLRALEQIGADEMDVPKPPTTDDAVTVDELNSPATAKRKRQSQSPTTPDFLEDPKRNSHAVVFLITAGILETEGSEVDGLEDSEPLKPVMDDGELKRPAQPTQRIVMKSRKNKRRKIDVMENALKRFQEDKTKTSRCVEFTSTYYPEASSDTTREKGTQKASNMRVQVGVSLAQGARPYMEDCYSVVERLFDDKMDVASSPSLLAVYDGHNGAYASEYARHRFKALLGENKDLVAISRRAQLATLTDEDVERICELLVDAFATVDAEILQRTVSLNKRDGSTVLLGLLLGGKLFVANLGDSRGVLAQIDDTRDATRDENVLRTVRLSVDHKPELQEEMDRVKEAGGDVIFSGCWRVAHDEISLRLAISRSLGDHPLKTNLPASCSAPLVSVVPDVRVLNVKAAGEYLVFASDGLWDRLSDDEAAIIVCSKVAEFDWSEEHEDGVPGSKEALQFAANALVETALRKRSMDNITAMVISFSELRDEESNSI
ncbi:hypothetical protein PsorP6_000853 [Peronosclerospora sorghi]|uniref:Uncharacterized protein n=1 Tax=Peronosclerospora sorghi TaxID=230839 RepID=A0ACC0WV07_9STRA|nr:hypothetical protein PsorP6_000853 [Peronosclerospora sorghi]